MTKLPIDEMNEAEFSKFKNRCLDNKVLSDETIAEISRLFSIGRPNRETAYVNCDEHHQHKYKCIRFYDPRTGIVDRLLIEIGNYKDRLEQVRKLTED